MLTKRKSRDLCLTRAQLNTRILLPKQILNWATSVDRKYYFQPFCIYNNYTYFYEILEWHHAIIRVITRIIKNTLNVFSQNSIYKKSRQLSVIEITNSPNAEIQFFRRLRAIPSIYLNIYFFENKILQNDFFDQ